MKRSSYRELDYAFGQLMLTLRTAVGVTQVGLAEILGVSRQAVGGWEAGETYPKAHHLKQYIELAMRHGAFPAGGETEEIRVLWRASHQKVLLDEHWLHDLLHQQLSPDSSPTVVSPSLRPRPLPIPPTPYIGRETELAQIARLLADPACRVLTICGPGGIGKTRLALEVVARHSMVFEHGAVFVELAPVSAVNQIIPTIADALRLSFVGQHDPHTYMLGYLQPLQLLLVLDNFEHIVDSAPIINDIVQHTPGVMIVTTSRERLNLRAEWVFDIEGLAYPQEDGKPGTGGSLTADPASYSAVRLFMHQAQRVQPTFRPSDGDMQVISRICRQVNGMPLAIELAAAWTRMMSVNEIEQQLHNEDLLTTTFRDVPARHRSLRTVFDQSWATLSEREQAFFAQLAVFRGGWTPEAAYSVCQTTSPVLAALFDKSLVRAESEESSTPRFTMLEPIREYALSRLAERGERAAVEQTHAQYYLALCESIVAPGDGTAEQEFDHIEHNHDNLRAALRWALDNHERAFGLRLAEALWLFWRRRGYLDEGRQWLADLMALPQIDAPAIPPNPRVPGREALAWLASDEQSFAQAVALFEQGLTIQRARGHPDALMDVLISGARQARSEGDYARATLLLERELAHYRARLDAFAVPQTALIPLLQELAMVMREQGVYARGQALWHECLDLQLAHNDCVSIAVAQMGLSDIARDRGDPVGVRTLCEQCLPVFREIGEKRGIAYCLNNLALAAFMDGHPAQAATLIQESVTIFSQLQGGPSLGEMLLSRGRITAAQGRTEHGQQDLTTAVRIAWAEGPRWLLAASLEALGEHAAQYSEAEHAARLLSTAAQLRRVMGTPTRLADRASNDRAVQIVRTKLGAQRADDIWAEAASRPLDQVIVEAVVDRSAEDSTPPNPARLSRNAAGSETE